jgi:hypothetical protein
LAGAVPQASSKSQLGGIGYTVAMEHAFYVFFAPSTLCIVSVLAAAGRAMVATRTDFWTRVGFLLAVACILAGAVGLYSSG